MGYRDYLTEIMLLDEGACVYCEESSSLVIDHLLPRIRGGTDELNNLVLACRRCNSSKNNRTPYEWGNLPNFGRFKTQPFNMEEPTSVRNNPIAAPEQRKKGIMVYFDEEVLARVDAQAKRQGLSRSSWLHSKAIEALDQ